MRRRSANWLTALNFCLADVQNGMGPFVALFLQASARWGPADIGASLAVGNLAQVAAQTPAGILIDRTSRKRALVAVGIAFISVSCVVTPLLPTRGWVKVAQLLVGLAGAVFPPALAALALGLAGRAALSRQLGRNQAANAAGNVVSTALIGLVGALVGPPWMFAVVLGLSAVSLFCVFRIDARHIDHHLARGADGASTEQQHGQDTSTVRAELESAGRDLVQLLRWPVFRNFLVCAVLFHVANAAMMPLATQALGAERSARDAIIWVAVTMCASQVVFVLTAALSGRLATKLGRKPLFLFAFGALCVRGLVFVAAPSTAGFIAVQILDGLGAGVFGVVSVLVVADLTKGTGRFNGAQGAVATAQGLGAFTSNLVAGRIAAHGMSLAFLLLSAAAAVGFILYARRVPETAQVAPVAG